MSSHSDTTRIPSSSTSSDSPPFETKHLPQTTSRVDPDNNHNNDRTDHYLQSPEFVQLEQKLTRTTTTHTQDLKNGEEFDLATYLKHVLRKSEKQGILRREIGVVFEGLTVHGNGSGLEYGPSMGEILAGPLRLPAKIKASR